MHDQASARNVGSARRLHPTAWMTDVLTKLVNLWPAARKDELMPWAWAAAQPKTGAIVKAA